MSEIDFLVIGAGAAGLTASLYASRSGLSCTVVDGSGFGGQAMQINELENYPGLFPVESGSQMMENLKKQAESFDVKFVFETVKSIDKSGDLFIVKTSSEELKAKSVLLATGASHRKLDVPGESEYSGKGVSYCAVCDGPFFRNKNVVVVGGGDSACTEAIYLSKIARHVELVHRRDSFRAQKIVVDRVLANPKISVRFDTVVKEIIGGEQQKNGGGVNSVLFENVKTSETEIFETDAVFVFVGMNPKTELLDILKTDDGGYFITNDDMSTIIPGLFVAGDVRSKPLRQIVTACSDGAIAAFSAEKYISLNNKQVEK